MSELYENRVDVRMFALVDGKEVFMTDVSISDRERVLGCELGRQAIRKLARELLDMARDPIPKIGRL